MAVDPLDALSEKLAVALDSEFGEILRPNNEDSWKKAARGILTKIGAEALPGNHALETLFIFKGV